MCVYIPFTGQVEMEKMINLVNSRPAERITDFPSQVDLQELLGVAEIQANTGLWEDRDGRLAGFAILDDTQLIFELASHATQGDLGQAIIRWGVERMQERYQVSEGSLELEVSCRDDDFARCSLLEGAGFQRLPWGAVHLARSLDEPIPAAQLPPGFKIRPLAGESEAPAWVALHRLAWGTENMTLEYKLSMMRTPAYDPYLDLVAVAPDGSLAAYCVCYISQEENALSGRQAGYTDPIATHPGYQRLGLAKALLLTGLRLLQQRGMHAARLGTSSENIAMQRTAQSVGFQIEHAWLRYSLLLLNCVTTNTFGAGSMKNIELVSAFDLPKTPPVPGLSFRGFQGEADFSKMTDIIQGCRDVDQLDRVYDAQSLARLYAHLVNFDISRDLLLAEVEGQVIGFAFSRWFLGTNGNYIHKHKGFLLPAWRRKGIGRYLLRFCEERQCQVAAQLSPDVAHFYESSANDTEYAAEALLRSEGYQPVRHFYVMVRPDLEDIPEAPLPPGLEVRPAKPEHYQVVCDANNEAFRDHWGHSSAYDLTVEKFLDNPDFDPSLWRVAWDGDQVAGMVLSYIDRKQNTEYNRLRGWTEDICVRRPWRQRGLARALIVLSLHALKERGMTEAALTVDTDNLTGALRLYEGVGFRSVKRFSMFHKPLTI